MKCRLPEPSLSELLLCITVFVLTIAGVSCMSSASDDASKDSTLGEIEQTDDIKIVLILLENSEISGYPHAKIVITNTSKQIFRIRYEREPLQYLNLVIFDSEHKQVSSGWYGAIFSHWGKERQVCLKLNEFFESSVDLFETLEKKNRKPGQYFIQAIFKYTDADNIFDRYKGKEYKSNTVSVTLREEK